MEVTTIALAIQNSWSEIEEWHRANAPRLLENLQDGASDQQIDEFEAATGVSLPEDYKASLKLHNGDVYIYDYQYLSLDGVLNKWLMMTHLSADGVFDGRNPVDAGGGVIQNTWWQRGWVPFAVDGGGNMICIDVAPAANGIVGQLLYMELQSGPGISQYKSFREWLERYRDDLHRGFYTVDEDGYLVERNDS